MLQVVSKPACKPWFCGANSANLQVTDSDCLEPLLIIVVYLLTMISVNKTSHKPRSASLPSFRQCLSYVLALLFVFVSLNPAQASMTMGQGMMNVAMDMSASGFDPAIEIDGGLLNQNLVNTDNSGHMMSEGDDCQSDCDCCPGLCSVCLPSNLTASTFLSANFALADSAFLGKVSTSTRLFRPPISH